MSTIGGRLRSGLKKFVIPAIVAGACASVGGVFVAGAASTSITACAKKPTGELRYAASGVCKASETKLTLGQTGPAGATGATGAAGATGASGSYASAMTVTAIAAGSGRQFALADAGTLITTGGTAVMTVPTNASVAFPIGTRIDLAPLSGDLYVSPASGVTINGVSVQLSFDSGGYQFGSLIKTGTNAWIFLRPLNEVD
ncbi:MAG: hypothetical protein ACKORC_04095 [Acidimicrobiia bacterium]